MNPIAKFVLRATLSALIAFMISRAFWKMGDLVWTVLLAVFLLTMGYLSEWMRGRRNSEEGSGDDSGKK